MKYKSYSKHVYFIYVLKFPLIEKKTGNLLGGFEQREKSGDNITL